MSKSLCLLHNPLESQRAKGGGLGSSDNLHDGSSNSEPYCRVGKILVALIVHGNHPAFWPPCNLYHILGGVGCRNAEICVMRFSVHAASGVGSALNRKERTEKANPVRARP